MKIVVLDGYTLNPGDITWEGMEALGELTVYDRTKAEDVAARIDDADVVNTDHKRDAGRLPQCEIHRRAGNRI
jgi:glycerate dehydrogenase